MVIDLGSPNPRTGAKNSNFKREDLIEAVERVEGDSMDNPRDVDGKTDADERDSWDPLRSDHASVDNRPDFRSDDADLVRSGFSTRSQYKKSCKWFR
jgi:hypothetical protein